MNEHDYNQPIRQWRMMKIVDENCLSDRILFRELFFHSQPNTDGRREEKRIEKERENYKIQEQKKRMKNYGKRNKIEESEIEAQVREDFRG